MRFRAARFLHLIKGGGISMGKLSEFDRPSIHRRDVEGGKQRLPINPEMVGVNSSLIWRPNRK